MTLVVVVCYQEEKWVISIRFVMILIVSEWLFVGERLCVVSFKCKLDRFTWIRFILNKALGWLNSSFCMNSFTFKAVFLGAAGTRLFKIALWTLSTPIMKSLGDYCFHNYYTTWYFSRFIPDGYLHTISFI